MACQQPYLNPAHSPACAVCHPTTCIPCPYITYSHPSHHMCPPLSLTMCHHQVLALFNKAIRKLHSQLHAAKTAALERTLPRVAPKLPATAAAAAGGAGNGLLGQRVEQGLDEELDEAAAAVKEQLRAQWDVDKLGQYAIKGAEGDFENAVGGTALRPGGIVSVKSSGAGRAAEQQQEQQQRQQQQQSGGKGKHKAGKPQGGKPFKKHKH